MPARKSMTRRANMAKHYQQPATLNTACTENLSAFPHSGQPGKHFTRLVLSFSPIMSADLEGSLAEINGLLLLDPDNVELKALAEDLQAILLQQSTPHPQQEENVSQTK